MKNRLLILDDEEAFGGFVARVAQDLGWAAENTATVEDFQARFRAAPPDAVTLDLQLGASDGVEQLRFLHAMRYTRPIVLISGFDSRVIDAAQQLGSSLGLMIVDGIQKPARVAAVRAVLERLGQVVAAPADASPPLPSGAEMPISAQHIDHALEAGEMALAYQPILTASTGQVEKLEALIRWHHPERGLVMPDEFISVGERETAVIDRLTMWVVRAAVGQYHSLRALERPIAIAVNISAKNLHSLDFPDKIDEVVRKAGLASSALTLEITESAATSDPTATMDILTRLRLKGFRLAIDDFGTGFSSLKALLRLPFSELKIDKSFVANVLTSRDALVIVKSVIDLARNMGLKTVAEGAETQPVMDRLVEFGVDYIQGYVVSRPLGADQLPAFLTASARPRTRPESA